MSDDDNNNNNVQVLQALERLSAKLVELDDSPTEDTKLSHWRVLPSRVATAYKLITDGATLVKATSTKYTLVGKVDASEGSKLSQDLLRGCELLSTGTFVLFQTDAGCSRSVRAHVKQSIRSVLATVVSLVQSFVDKSAFLHKNEGAQKTGAVWSSCDVILNKKLPQGNRAAMRRDLFTWSMECHETMTEFQEMVEKRNSNGGDGASEQEEDDSSSWDDFCNDDTDDQYTTKELPIVQATLALLKCSRGTLNVTLKACECAGEQLLVQTKENSDDNDDDASQQQQQQQQNDQILEWIQSLHNMARLVGEGVTDLGILLYPPLELQQQQQSGESPLETQLNLQRNAIVKVQNYVLDAHDVNLSEEITEMATKLRATAQTRYDEAIAAIITTKLSSE